MKKLATLLLLFLYGICNSQENNLFVNEDIIFFNSAPLFIERPIDTYNQNIYNYNYNDLYRHVNYNIFIIEDNSIQNTYEYNVDFAFEKYELNVEVPKVEYKPIDFFIFKTEEDE